MSYPIFTSEEKNTDTEGKKMTHIMTKTETGEEQIWISHPEQPKVELESITVLYKDGTYEIIFDENDKFPLESLRRICKGRLKEVKKFYYIFSDSRYIRTIND